MSLYFKSKTDFESQVSKQAMETVELIISEMGAEIHDDLIQRLSIFRLYMDRLERSKEDLNETEAILIHMNADFQDVIQTIRNISRRLLPVKMKEDSFHTAISMLCQNLERPGGGTIHLEASGEEQRIPDLADVYLYRIVQELIHNSLKHSSAWHIWVRLQWNDHHLTIEVEDDGSGIIKIPEFIKTLESKISTIKMRCKVIGAATNYSQGLKGLLARVEYQVPVE